MRLTTTNRITLI